MKQKTFFITLSLITILGYGYFAFAAAPIGGYTPGQTLNPDCAPGDVDCVVTLPSGGSVTADNGLTATGSNVQLGGTLLQDTVIDQNGKDFLVKDGNYFFGKVADVTTIAPFPFTDPFIGSGYLDTGTGDSYLNGFINTADGRYMILLQKNGFSHYMALDGNNDGFEFSAAETNSDSFAKYGTQRIELQQRDLISSQYASIFVANTGIQFNSDLGSYTFPRTDGLANQVLTTDGAGQLSWQNAGGGGSDWSLTGNAGTTVGTNFIGTTDATDFMVKTNGNQIALFGQNGNVAIGSSLPADFFGPGTNPALPPPIASGSHSFVTGPGSIASGNLSTALGVGAQATGLASFAIGFGSQANGQSSVAFGQQAQANGFGSFAFSSENYAIANGDGSIVLGDNSIANGNEAIILGQGLTAESYSETSLGFENSPYIPSSTGLYNRLLNIGNGSQHNAYTLWKDGSFAYNDDNFQNDNIGTEQNMFYFNYGNHDGLGGVNTKRAIRLGSVSDNTWDVTSANVGDRSIALGFSATPLDPSFTGPIASGLLSFATQLGVASGDISTSFGNGISTGFLSMSWGGTDGGVPSSVPTASGDYSTAWGNGLNQASGQSSTAFGDEVTASGLVSTAFGSRMYARSLDETAFGSFGTDYSPVDSINFNLTDRLVNIGNGAAFGSESDTFTILKDGRTGIAVDNFETNALPFATSIFQVGDGSTGIIGYVDNGTGNWVAVSDERKKDNITDLTYGLHELMQLRPTSFNYKRNNEHTIGFLAQQVLPIIPEAVYGTESEGYGMSYATLTPVIVKAIQEMNLNVTSLSDMTRTNTWRDAMVAWFGNAANGIEQFVAGTIKARTQVCIDDVCVNKQQLQQILQNNGINQSTPIVNTPPPVDPGTNPGTGDSTSVDTGDIPTDPSVPPTDSPLPSGDSSGSDTGSAPTAE